MRLIVHFGLLLCGGITLALTLAAAYTRRGVTTPPAAWIAFVHDDYVTGTLYRARVVGGTPQRVAEGRAMSTPTWSPDGAWLAFSAADDDDHFVLYRVRPGGSGLERLTPPALNASTPDWSPDGAWLVYVEWFDTAAPIYRIRPDGTGREALTTVTARDDYRAPVWSPNGVWIAYTRVTGDNATTIEIMRADGREPRVLIQDRLISFAPEWSPDSRWIAFQSNLDANPSRIYRVPLVGGDPIPVSPPVGYTEAPTWSPDGKWLLFALSAPLSNNLYRAHPDGTSFEQIVDFPRPMRSPAWGPSVDVPFRPGVGFGVGIACLAGAYFLRPRSKNTP